MTAAEKGLAVVPPQQITVPSYALAPAIDWEEVERLVNELYLPNATRADRVLLMAWCRRVQLDPLTQDVVVIQHRPFVTLAGLTKVADRSGHMDGCTATSELLTTGPYAGKYVATATVWRNDRSHPTVMQARQWEHERLKQPGKQDGPWDKSPAAMTEKCALARALRLSFSLVGLTAAEEVGYDEESEETNAGKVVVIQPDQGRPGRAPAQLPAAGQATRVAAQGEPDQAAAAPESGAEDFTWTEFWPWAKARGLKGKADLDAALGRDTKGMTAHAAYVAVRTQESGAKERRGWTVDDAFAWLQGAEKSIKKQEQCCTWIFRQQDDQAWLDEVRAKLAPIVHQDALDAAWHDRMVELDRWADVAPPVEAEPAAEEPTTTPTIEELRDAIWNGDPGDDVPF